MTRQIGRQAMTTNTNTPKRRVYGKGGTAVPKAARKGRG